MNNYKNFVQRLPNKELELLLIAIFEDKVMKFIADNAIVTNKEIASDDLLKKISDMENKDKNKKKDKNAK